MAGCAASPLPRVTFAEAGLQGAPAPVRADDRMAPDAGARREEPPLAAVPPVRVPAPEVVPSEEPEGPPIDSTLMRFAGEARGRRLAGPGARGFPRDAVRAWRALVVELDDYLTRPLPQTPLLELVRAEVTVEAELDYDQRRYGPAPAGLAPEVLARARRLDVRIRAARALGQSMFVKRAPGRLRWPLENAGLSSGFGPRLHPFTGERQLHAGIDLAADKGRVVSAASKGYVVRAGWVGGYGLLVEVRHPGDVTTRYGHLSALLCAAGDPVEPGAPLGLVGQTGLATGPHLHFEVWLGGAPKDPLAWLGGGSRLAGRGDIGGGP